MATVEIEPDETARRLREYCREHPELRKERYHVADRLDGHCYTLSESYFHGKGGLDSGLDIYCLSWADVDAVQGDGTHWYLKDPDTDTWIDLGLETIWQAAHIPFHKGRRRAFITGYEPSNRTKTVLDALSLDY